MKKKSARWNVAIISLALASTFVLFTAAPVLAQDGQTPDAQEKEVPPELQEKVEEFKEAADGLRAYGALLKSDLREFRSSMKELLREARSLSRDEKWELLGDASDARDEYAGAVKERIEAARETAGAMKEALAAARDAWEEGDLDGALSCLDQAIAKAGELEVQLDEAHRLLGEILDAVAQLKGQAGAASATTWWAV